MLEKRDGKLVIVGPSGTLEAPEDDEIIRKLAMLVEGECLGLGPVKAAEKYDLSYQRYYQLRQALREEGAIALQSKKRGPKTNYRRTPEATRQIIRHKFLDPEASAEVIAQKMNQCSFKISASSVLRTIDEFGLEKKTLQIRS